MDIYSIQFGLCERFLFGVRTPPSRRVIYDLPLLGKKYNLIANPPTRFFPFSLSPFFLFWQVSGCRLHSVGRPHTLQQNVTETELQSAGCVCVCEFVDVCVSLSLYALGVAIFSLLWLFLAP